MAKRRRLEVPVEPFSPELETKTAFSRPPVAQIASDVAGRAAEAEMAAEMEVAEAEGRVIRRIAVEAVDVHHLARDRMAMDPDDMAALQASIADRGQQTPIEVIAAGGGRYGLISGLRRLKALEALGRTEVLALIRKPKSAEAAYRAMIEENEIRADLSFYERANIAVMAVGQGVYPTHKRAVQGLFQHVPSAKRSKILKFVTIREKLDRALRFPTAITEKTGLALATAIEADIKVASRIADALRKTPPEDAGAERRTIERALKGQGAAMSEKEKLAQGVTLEARAGRAVLTGPGVDEAFLAALRSFAVSHAK